MTVTTANSASLNSPARRRARSVQSKLAERIARRPAADPRRQGAPRVGRERDQDQSQVERAVSAAIAQVAALTDERTTGVMNSVVREHLATGGKRVRIQLTLQCAAAIGVPADQAVPVAVATELLHNATLIHDDLQDGDVTRRGQPTVWARHGMAQAINAGDVLLMLPFVALSDAGPRSAQLSGTLARRASATACGQADELAMLDRERLDWRSYVAMCEGKTGQILAIPFESAVLLAGHQTSLARRVGDLVTPLGLAYQVADDVLDLVGDKGRETAGNDLREGKVSALVAVHLELVPSDRDALLATLRRPRDETTDTEVAEWIEAFVASGAVALALSRAAAAMDDVDACLLPAEIDGLRVVWRGLRERFLAPAEAALADWQRRNTRPASASHHAGRQP